MRLYLLIILLWVLPLTLWADDSDEKEVFIREIHWILKNYEDMDGAGFTREASLYRAFRISENDLFRNKDRLIRRIETGIQELESRRLFKHISYEVFFSEEEDHLWADIYITIVDRWNIAAFPRAAYDTNLGLQYGGRIMYKNLFGTLIDLDITGYWSESQWDVTGEFSNLDLLFFQGSLFYTQHFEEVLSYSNDEQLESQYTYQTSHLQLRVDFPLGPGLGYYIMPGFLTTHSFDIEHNYTAQSDADLIEENSNYAGAFMHGVAWDKVKWEGNVREGFHTGLDNWFEISFDGAEESQVDWDAHINGYLALLDQTEIALGLSSFYIINNIRNNAGDRLRGIKDSQAYGQWGVYMNSSLSSQSLYLPPVVEIHLSPFVDAGYLVSPGEGLEEEDNFFLSGGLSVVIFPLPFKSLQISVMLGYDLLNPGPYELGIYTGLFF